jgi:uncharacterized iron-regulated membrane protein
MPKKGSTAVAKPTTAPKEEPLPWYGALVNHLLTPGSSLTTGVWNLFNLLIGGVFLVWLMFFAAFPTSIHVWVFFALLVGLAVSTNWFMKEIFNAKEDFVSVQERKAKEEAEKAKEEPRNGDVAVADPLTGAATPAVEAKSNKPAVAPKATTAVKSSPRSNQQQQGSKQGGGAKQRK